MPLPWSPGIAGDAVDGAIRTQDTSMPFPTTITNQAPSHVLHFASARGKQNHGQINKMKTKMHDHYCTISFASCFFFLAFVGFDAISYQWCSAGPGRKRTNEQWLQGSQVSRQEQTVGSFGHDRIHSPRDSFGYRESIARGTVCGEHNA